MIILPVVIRIYLVTTWMVLPVLYLYFCLDRTKIGFIVKLKQLTSLQIISM